MSMCRYDTKEEEKKLADEIKRHSQKAKPQNFDINPYFLLNEKCPIVEILESAKKSDHSNRSLNQVEVSDFNLGGQITSTASMI